MKRGINNQVVKLDELHNKIGELWHHMARLARSGAFEPIVSIKEKFNELVDLLDTLYLTHTDLKDCATFQIAAVDFIYLQEEEKNDWKIMEVSGPLIEHLTMVYIELFDRAIGENLEIAKNFLRFLWTHQLEFNANLLKISFLDQDGKIVRENNSTRQIEHANYKLYFEEKIFDRIYELGNLEFQVLGGATALADTFDIKLNELIDILVGPTICSSSVFKEYFKINLPILENEELAQNNEPLYISRTLSAWLISFCNISQNPQINKKIYNLILTHELDLHSWSSQNFSKEYKRLKQGHSQSHHIELSKARFCSFFEEIPIEKILDFCKKEIKHIFNLDHPLRLLFIQNIIQRISNKQVVEFLNLLYPNSDPKSSHNPNLLWYLVEGAVIKPDPKVDELTKYILQHYGDSLDLERSPFYGEKSVKELLCTTDWGKQWYVDFSRRKLIQHLEKIQVFISEKLQENKIVDLETLLEETEVLADNAFLEGMLNAYCLLAHAYKQIGDVGNFKRVLAKTPSNNPHYLDPDYEAVKLCEELGDFENLEVVLKEMATNNINYAKSVFLLAKTYARIGKIEDLKKLIEKTQADNNPHYNEICLLVADCLLEQAAKKADPSWRENCLTDAIHYTFLIKAKEENAENLRSTIGFNYVYGDETGNAKVGSFSQKAQEEPLLANFSLSEEKRYLLYLSTLRSKNAIEREKDRLKSENEQLKAELEALRKK